MIKSKEQIANRYAKLLGIKPKPYFFKGGKPEVCLLRGSQEGFSLYLTVNKDSLSFYFKYSFLPSEYSEKTIVNPTNEELIKEFEWYKQQEYLANNLDVLAESLRESNPVAWRIIQSSFDRNKKDKIKQDKFDSIRKDWESNSENGIARVLELLKSTYDKIKEDKYVALVHEYEDKSGEFFIGCNVCVSGYIGG